MTARPELDRYAVQRRVEQIGPAGQTRLGRSTAVVVGAGALGSTISQLLVRAGVGRLRLIDSDRVELGNLHRQLLYLEEDVASRQLKAEIAAQRLRAANGEVEVEAQATRLTEANADELLAGADVVVDGTDNLTTRELLNRRCLALDIPWIYGGIAGVHGLVLPVLPGRGPCLRCLFPGELPQIESQTAQTTGVFGPAAAVIGALEASQAIRLLVGDLEPPIHLLSIDVWTGALDRLPLLHDPECPACAPDNDGKRRL